jgi:hypothetical protein
MPEVHLPLELPDELSDEAVAQLVECLYEIARSLESCYLGQLLRYYEARCEEPGPEVDPRQRSLWPESELEF